MQQRLHRFIRAALPMAFAVVLATPHAAVAAVDSGGAAFTGNGTANPGLSTSGQTQTYTLGGTLAGSADGVPFTASCSLTGSSTGTETVAEGMERYGGTCNGSGVGVGGSITVTCTASGSGAATLGIIRAGAVAVVEGHCHVTISWNPPPINVDCDATVAGVAVLYTTAPNPTIVTFGAAATLLVTCAVSVGPI